MVETSLIRSGVYAIGADMATYLRLGGLASNRGRKQATVPLVNFFKTSDEQWVCVMPRDARSDWPNICKAAGRPGLVDAPGVGQHTREVLGELGYTPAEIEAMTAGPGPFEIGGILTFGPW